MFISLFKGIRVHDCALSSPLPDEIAEYCSKRAEKNPKGIPVLNSSMATFALPLTVIYKSFIIMLLFWVFLSKASVEGLQQKNEAKDCVMNLVHELDEFDSRHRHPFHPLLPLYQVPLPFRIRRDALVLAPHI